VPDQSDVNFVALNKSLEEVANVFSTFINKQEVKNEILSFANNPSEESYIAFEDLLNYESSGRINSSIIAGIRSFQSASSGRRAVRDVLDLEQFLLENDYALYAPYYAEDLSDSDEPITISWWDGQVEGQDTPGIQTGDQASSGRVDNLLSINDDYASTHPTLILVPNDQPIRCMGAEYARCSGEGGGSTGGGTGGGVPTTPRNIDCRDLADDATVKMKMPEFRLTGNTRGWPYRNNLQLSIITGNYSVDSNGSVNASPDKNDIWTQQIVSRSDAKNRRWKTNNSSFILSNWSKSKVEMRVFMSHRQSNGIKSFKGEVKVTDDGNQESTTSVSWEEKTEKAASKMFNVAFDRCTFLGDLTEDGGFGIREGYQIYQWDQVQFYLEPDVRL